MNTKILGSMLLIGLVSLSAVAGTWAYFNDEEASLDNVFTAGVIDLQVDASRIVYDEYGAIVGHEVMFSPQDSVEITPGVYSLPKFFNYCSVPDHDIKPGQCGEVTISLHVGESNDANLFMDIVNIRDSMGVTSEPELMANPENDINDLSTKLQIIVWKDCGACNGGVPGDNIFVEEQCDLLIYEGSLAGFEANTLMYTQVPADTTVYVGFYWMLPTSVTNEYQGDVTEFDVLFTAEQVIPEDLDPQCTPTGTPI